MTFICFIFNILLGKNVTDRNAKKKNYTFFKREKVKLPFVLNIIHKDNENKNVLLIWLTEYWRKQAHKADQPISAQ